MPGTAIPGTEEYQNHLPGAGGTGGGARVSPGQIDPGQSLPGTA